MLDKFFLRATLGAMTLDQLLEIALMPVRYFATMAGMSTQYIYAAKAEEAKSLEMAKAIKRIFDYNTLEGEEAPNDDHITRHAWAAWAEHICLHRRQLSGHSDRAVADADCSSRGC